MLRRACRRLGVASLTLGVLSCAGCLHDLVGDKTSASLAARTPHRTTVQAADIAQDNPPPPAAAVGQAAPENASPPTAGHGTRSVPTTLAGQLPQRRIPSAGAAIAAAILRQDQVAEVLEGLQALERLDPPTRATIQASLDRTHPANWPYVFRFYRAALSGQVALAPPGQVALTPPGHAGDLAPAQPAVWGFARGETAARPGRAAPNALAPHPLSQNPYSPTPLTASPAPNVAVLPSGTVPGVASPPPDARLATSQAKTSTRQPRRSATPPEREAPSDSRDDHATAHAHWWPVSTQKADAVETADEGDPAAGGWERQLDQTIHTLEAATRDGDDPYHHALLRVLYAVAGRREDALRPIPAATDAQRDFWTKEMRGLTECLDRRQAGSPDRRAAEAVRWFRDAAGRLAEMAALDVRNLAFCSAIHSFGALERFEKSEFQAGDAVLLYAELENFAVESTSAGYRTSFKARYDVLDGPRRVHEQELPAAQETCERQRRDFFVGYQLRLPASLKPGEYTLQLTIDDVLGHKTATRSIAFRIK